MININAVIQNVPTEEKEPIQMKRIIWIIPDSEFVFAVTLKGEGMFPFIASMDEIEIGIATGTILLIKDPYARVINDKDISPQLKEARDKKWEIVQFLWHDNKELVLNRKTRKSIIREAATKFYLPKYEIDRIIKRFWQRGMNKNALLADYINCGKKVEKNYSGKKLGRSRKYSEPRAGINIDENIKRIFRQVIDNHYRPMKKPNLSATYKYMLEKHFSDHYKDQNGEIRAKIWSKDRLPSDNQFRYWHKKEFDFKKDYIGHYGENAFNLHYRELLGNSMAETLGPGSIYQIDATVADVYLVNPINPLKVIGRPVVYIVIDVFSRMVTGLYVGLEGPSWLGAMMVLDNVVEPKAQFCLEHGFEIAEEEWPCKYLPERLVADRGELEGYNADRLESNLNINMDNTPPYRGDLKAIVERHFKTVNDRIKYTSPGAVQREYRTRSDEDPRLKAEYTLDDFIKFMIIDVMWHNKHINPTYTLSRGMLADGILPKPIDMWNWGVKNRKGRFNVYSRDFVRLTLLPIVKANITRAGIKISDRYYSFDKAISEGWFTTGKNKRTDFSYDPRDVNRIYLPHETGEGFDVANLLEKSNAYKDLTWEEARFIHDSVSEDIDNAKRDDLQNDIDRDMATQKINTEAKKRMQKAKKSQPQLSKNQRIKGIGENRNEEKERIRENEKFILGDSEQKEGQILPFKSMDTELEDTSETESLGMNKANNQLLDKLTKHRDQIFGKDEE
ncbi:MAG: transposase [Firmicutes bacterium HGW-Firmicutes-15]|nr:MAG: transposase [Firmicutes bacterium HGW-Firmicutes-15]